MKKILLITILIVVCTALVAEITFYGSARVGFWYDITDEDYNIYTTGIDQSRTHFDQSLQKDSYFGVDFTHGNLAAKVEFGFDVPANRINIEYIWARRYFRNWALVIGKDDFGSCLLANQAFNSGLGLDGYGALTTGPVAQVRFEVNIQNDLFYIAFMETASRATMLPVWHDRNMVTHDPTPGLYPDDINLFMPRIMIGYNIEHPNIRVMPMVMFQAWQFNDDGMETPSHDDFKSAWLIALTTEMNFDRVSMRLHGHYGQNLGNLGFTGDFNRMLGTIYRRHATDEKRTINTSHTVCLGGHFTIGYDFTENFNLNAGVGFSTTEINSGFHLNPNDPEDLFFSNNDERLAFYLQGIKRINNFSLVPEFGMFIENKDVFGREQGSQIYFGTQLRFDF